MLCSSLKKSAPILFTLLLAPAGCELLQPITQPQAIQLLNDPYRPDARREGIAAMVTRWEVGKHAPYLNQYRQLAVHDPDYTVRAMAIRALNICRDTASSKIFIAGLTDENVQIRLESAKALANIPDPDAIPALEQVLSESRRVITADGHPNLVAEDTDVRVAAADALRHYRKLDVARTLVGYLDETNFGVAWQAHQSLVTLTGKDLNYDQANWLQYLIGPDKPFG